MPELRKEDGLWWWGRTPVPYITSWSAETGAITESGYRLTARFTCPEGRPDLMRVSYVDEVPVDRDRHGVLWQRYPLLRGRGEPQFSRVHPRRQRRAMERRLCQVCAAPADRDEHGWLWLLTRSESVAWLAEQEVRTANPPVCRRCAPLAARMCPSLRRGHTLVRAGGVQAWGVHGVLGSPHGVQRTLECPYEGDQRARLMLAGQQLVTLTTITTEKETNP